MNPKCQSKMPSLNYGFKQPLVMYNLFIRRAEINKRRTCGSPTTILITKSLNRFSVVNPKTNINIDMQQYSNITNTKILNELAIKDRPTSPLVIQVKIIKCTQSSKIV